MLQTKRSKALVKFTCSVCGRKLAVASPSDDMYVLYARGFDDQYLQVLRCSCGFEYPPAALEWRWGFHKDNQESEMPF